MNKEISKKSQKHEKCNIWRQQKNFFSEEESANLD